MFLWPNPHTAGHFLFQIQIFTFITNYSVESLESKMNFKIYEELNINFLLRDFESIFEQSCVDSATVTSPV